MATRQIFRGFGIHRFGIGPLHYISSHSDFGFEFAEIFVIEKRLGKSGSRRVGESGSRRLAESGSHFSPRIPSQSQNGSEDHGP